MPQISSRPLALRRDRERAKEVRQLTVWVETTTADAVKAHCEANGIKMYRFVQDALDRRLAEVNGRAAT